NGFTKLFLVVLRLAIGWHLLFEGVVKVRTHELGKTTTNTPFSSAPYLRDASGPLASFFHQQAGDLDEEAQAKLGMLPKENGDPNARIPTALESDWDAYFARWTKYYQVSEDQERQANEVLAKAKEKAAAWLQGREGEKEIPKAFAGVEAKPKKKPTDRIAEYRDKLRQLHEMQAEALPEFQRDVFKKQLTDKKAEVAKLRTELIADLDGLLRESLQALLTPAQRAMPPLPDPALAQPRDWLPESWPTQLSFARGLLPPASGSTLVHWTDWLVRLGLVCIGIGLLLGLFTRFSCVMGVLLILLITLPYLPLPGLPDSPRSLPFYYVNQNIIEAIALLALATTKSGRWVGLDGLLYVLRPSRYRAAVDTGPSPNGAVGARRMAETI
ncbi:MAG TPA: DoxX family protein, partial [Gemmataceae bacterium]|nr:DoxX family protein [Gemmataceae bacterium]